jgi:NAD+ kinase
MTVKKVGILYHPKVEATRSKAGELAEFLKSRGVAVWLGSAWERDEARAQLGGTDLVLTVGGDGTILRAAQVVAPGATPITGINLGRLGFMTELGADEATGALPQLLEGGVTETRAMLQAELDRPGRESRIFHALNDVVVARGEIARVVRIEASIDGQPLTTYRADGVIVATATGSTGYALAAGGPVLHPLSRDFVLVPVAPHLSAAYPLVLPETAEVKLRLAAVHPATLCVDGHINLPLASGDAVTLRRSPCTVSFWRRRPEASFYSSLEERLERKPD